MDSCFSCCWPHGALAVSDVATPIPVSLLMESRSKVLPSWIRSLSRHGPQPCQNKIGFTGTAFRVPELKWAQTAYMGPQMHPYDRMFFDPALGNGTNGSGYTVDRWLADLNVRFGGIDKALLWPTYTNLGADEPVRLDSSPSWWRQFGLAHVVDQLHSRGVKVLWAYNPWDHSTRGSERNNVTDITAMAELMRDTHADGFNGDTMGHIPR